jgi:hypothetical protein
MAGAAVATVVLVIQVITPLTQGLWFLVWPQDYFLAMAHFMRPEIPYPFFWTPGWEYRLGALTPLMAAGGAVALGAGFRAQQAGARIAVVPVVLGVGAVLAFVVGAAITAVRISWYGIPL